MKAITVASIVTEEFTEAFLGAAHSATNPAPGRVIPRAREHTARSMCGMTVIAHTSDKTMKVTAIYGSTARGTRKSATAKAAAVIVTATDRGSGTARTRRSPSPVRLRIDFALMRTAGIMHAAMPQAAPIMTARGYLYASVTSAPPAMLRASNPSR